MVPASLFSGLRVDRAQGAPQARVSVGDHQPRTAHLPLPQIPQDRRPAPGGLPMPRGHSHHDL